MFDKIISLIQQFFHVLVPFYTIDEWERAIILRNGKYHRTVGPGLYMKIPVIEMVWKHTVITQSIDIPPQSVTTSDGKNVVVKGIIRFSIYDIRIFLTTITEPKDVLMDTTGGMIRDIIEQTEWDNLVNVDKRLTHEVSRFVKKWGIKVDKVTLTDLQIANSIRIISDGVHQSSRIVPMSGEENV